MKKYISILLTLLLLLSFAVTAYAAENDTEGGDEPDGAYIGDGLNWMFADGALTISGEGEMADFEKEPAPWYDLRDQIELVVIEDGVSYIGAYAFEDYDRIEEVKFGKDVKVLGKRSFAKCDGLTSIHLPKAFKRFDEEALRACKNLKEIHCDGSFPRFELNCLWETECILYYPASAPWSVIYIEQLETAFHNRIEFLDSNGVDHFTPTEPTEAPTTVPTTAPTTAPTMPPVTAPTAEPTTVPTTEPETTEAPTTEDTRETFLLGTEETTRETEAPKKSTSGVTIGLAIVAFVLSVCGLAVIAFRMMMNRE